ncbi:MAG TPA: S46 family peptidase [Flavobacteriales bacterium]|nr:S46 family peptidase [Flavobacteriales bacterium]HNA31604.1 S46 family peptidase [Flavobacteriales bacterium]
MKKFFLLAVLLGTTILLRAQEGMWMLNTLKQVNESDMKRLGFQLTADDVYNVNASSMKDAVARLGGGFCSGEIVSADGLMLTNHHCGYDAIQSLSSVEHDYLTDGFWAKTRAEELPGGFYVSFLQRIDNVSERVLATLNDGMSEEERQAKIAEIGATLEQEAVGELKHISADFKTMYEGNEFYIFVYKDYPDVRLVGAPPSAIGKFGGDTDNWMWPRHTGDFSMFRVYTGPDGEPAPPAAENIPFKPKYWFPISLEGVQEGDFSMVMGCPGSTDRFLSSQGVQLALDVEQPSRVKIRRAKLDVYDKHMEADNAVRIQYASKYAQVSNYWKYFIGQQRGLKRLHVFDKKKKLENDLSTWIDADPARKSKYGGYLSELEAGYAERAKYEKANTYMQEAAFGCEALINGIRIHANGLYNELSAPKPDAAKVAAIATRIQRRSGTMWGDYNAPTDQEVTAEMFRLMGKDLPADMRPAVINDVILKKFKGNYDAWAAALFKTSILCDSAKFNKFMAAPSAKVLKKDLGFQAAQSAFDLFQQVGAASAGAQLRIDRGYRLMVAAMREREPGKMWYPNANSTIRMSYGQVAGYKPGDAMHYDHITTANGILEKEDNTNDEFKVPAREHELLVKRDYGRYADKSGELVPCFISRNDITGGNSGSPVINGKGQLIGIAFDGNWEAMSGDIAYETELQRMISVDIRYVLWTIDKFAGAKHLVDEMTIAPPTPVAPPPAPVGDALAPKGSSVPKK